VAAAKKKDVRTQRERARTYQARRQFNASQERRRVRDNLVGGIAGGVLLIAVLALQVGYYTAGPGRPAPAPTSATPDGTPSPTTTAGPVSPTPTAPPSPSATP
jgi:hypothetical protein